ncbi:hypothetical protein RM543_04700 [Roseicyclus sp. F158]|uniref:Uncharacterized protein n=1 Tax=Tropicimonas omnivorans TaxID=3075590 RepID=A0ABU3DE36_9RHOB|nr:MULTISPECIES: hypothetical protein [Roseobacteraceae]MDT0681976.1 hypothetical protein [Roseicyclus sp. F158]
MTRTVAIIIVVVALGLGVFLWLTSGEEAAISTEEPSDLPQEGALTEDAPAGMDAEATGQ